MGMYDTVYANCPKCGEPNGFQSKSGECLLQAFSLDECPDNVLSDVNRHNPSHCEADDCDAMLSVDIENRKVIQLK